MASIELSMSPNCGTKENEKSLTVKEKIAEKLRCLAKNKPLKLTKADNAADIVLEASVTAVGYFQFSIFFQNNLQPNKKEVSLDSATKWLMEKAQLKDVPLIPTKSPKTPKQKRSVSKSK